MQGTGWSFDVLSGVSTWEVSFFGAIELLCFFPVPSGFHHSLFAALSFFMSCKGSWGAQNEGSANG
jgi:hypothetical protein